MENVLEVYTTEDQGSVVRPLWANGLNAKDIRKKSFLFAVGSVCHVKRFITASRNSLVAVDV
jgi:hypothetical protein